MQVPVARTAAKAEGSPNTNPGASPQQLLRMTDSPQLDQPPPPTDEKSVALAAANALPNLVPLKPKMIIKGILGRYERWNPVHPTAGAFWGMGIGLGCGVGWGPGFGPEVVGYVGAGCGVGFSIGVTLAGVGIGLPQHVLVRSNDQSGGFPSNMTLESARYYTMTIARGLVRDVLGYASQISGGGVVPKLGKGVSSSIQSNRRS